MPAPDTEHAKHAATENPSATPEAEFPDSARIALEKEWFRLWRAFQHDVHVATNSLMYLLDAIHSIHLAEQQRAIETMSVSDGCHRDNRGCRPRRRRRLLHSGVPEAACVSFLGVGAPLCTVRARRPHGAGRVQGLDRRRLRPVGQRLPDPVEA